MLFIIDHLTKSNFPYSSPSLCVNSNNEILVKSQESYWWLYKFVEGDTSGFFLPNHISAAKVGVLVAEYHKAVRNINHQHFQEYQLTLFETKNIKEQITKISSNIREITVNNNIFLIDKINDFWNAYIEIPEVDINKIKQLKKIPIHYDFHGNNILTTDDNITGLIDFDSLAIGSRIIDIQNALFYVASTNDGINISRLQLFMEGYCSTLPISLAEKNLIYPVMIDRLLVLLIRCLKDKNISDQYFSPGNNIYIDRLIGFLTWLISNKQNFIACLLSFH